jgi:hypothetical protein
MEFVVAAREISLHLPMDCNEKLRRNERKTMTILNQLLLIQTETAAPQMTTGGWIFMIGAWTGIIALVIFCFSKILFKNRKR